LICTIHTKVRSSIGDRTRLIPERNDGYMVSWCLYYTCTDERGTFRHLEIAPKDEPDLWRSTIYLFSHDVKQIGVFPPASSQCPLLLFWD
jgi:hypothetical protein